MADLNEAAASGDLNYVLVLYEPADHPVAAEPEDGGALLQALENDGGHQLTSTGWLLKTSQPAAQVFQSLSRLTMPGDALLVADIRGVGTQGIEDGHILFADLHRRSGGSASPEQS